MKKIICILALALTAFSCSKDEDAVTVVATWDRNQVGTIAADGTVSNLVNYTHYCPSEKDNFSFTSNGVFKSEELNDNSAVEVTLAKTSESIACTSYEDNGTYALNGSTLTLTFTNHGTYNEVYEVVSLTATELKLKRAASVKRTTMSSSNYYTFTKR
jgi:hypothetical protein